MKILEDRIVWDREDFIKGFIPYASGANSQRYNFTGATQQQNVDPFYLAPGILVPGPAASNITGTAGGGSPVPNSVLHDATLDLGGNNAYALGTDLQKIQVSPTDEFIDDANWPHAITAHGGHVTASGALGSVVFANRSGTSKLFYSWTDNTDWDVGEHDLSTTFDDDFMSTVPSTPLSGSDLTDGVGKAHPLIYTADDRVLMGSGRYVHSYKCSTSAFNSKVLTLPVGMETVGFVEDGYDTVVFGTTGRGSIKRARAAAYWWSIDRPASYYRTSNIPDDEVSAPFVYQGTIGCFTRSRSKGGKSVLRILEGDTWAPKYYWTGSLPTVGGVEIQEETVQWNSDGKLYRWGPYGGVFDPGTHQYASGSGSSSGFLKSFSNGSTSGLYASTGTGLSGVQSFSNYDGNAVWVGCPASPSFGMRKKGKLLGIQVTMAGGASGGGRGIRFLLLDDSFTGQQIKDYFKSYTASERILFFQPDSTWVSRFDNFTSLAPYVQWDTGDGATNAPGIERIEAFYEPVDYVVTG